MKSLLKITILLIISLLIPISVVAGEQPSGNSMNATLHETPVKAPDKILPSREDVLAFARNVTATNSTTLENQIIVHNASWYWDTYNVKTNEGTEYNIVVVYDNEKTKTNFGRVQLMTYCKGIGLVQPAPMVIGRPLNITGISGKWNLKTLPIKSYKIVNSYFGVTSQLN